MRKTDADLKVYIEGFTFGLGKVHRVEQGFAAGYYSYGTTEKMEVFFHVNDRFVIEYECFSKKFWNHEMRLDMYYHHNDLTLDVKGKKMVQEEKILGDSREERFGSGPHTYDKNETPEEMLKYAK